MSSLKKPSGWDIVYSIAMALACLISYTAMTSAGMGILLAAGTLVNVLLERREDIITTAVTTIIAMVVAVISPADAWKQPLLRLFDTVVGIVIGVAGKWIASFAFYRARGEAIR